MEQIGSTESDRAYFAQRAAEEQELALAATSAGVADVHRRLQRAYLERASIGAREQDVREEIG